MKKFKSTFLLLFMLTLFTSCVKEIEAEEIPIGNLSGIVIDKFDNPLKDATISLPDYTLRTNAQGEFSGLIPVGEYSVSVSRDKYLTQVTKIKISRDETTSLIFILEVGEPEISISDDHFSFSEDSGVFHVEVTSNADWTVVNNSDWISGPGSGGGNMTVEFAYTENESAEPRSDTLYFVSGTAQSQLVVNQEKKLAIIHVEGISGNLDNVTRDSVYVLFNKPISVIVISSNWNSWSTNTYKLTDDSHGVRFEYWPASLGREHPFNIRVKDNFEKTHSLDFGVPFFDTRMTIEGFISDFIMINDDKEVLVAAYNPSRLIRYSLLKDSILQTYDLSQYISPLKLSYSPNNSSVYIMGSLPDASLYNTRINRPDIYRFDWQTGAIVKATTIEKEINDPSQHPTIIPFDLEFTQSGLGIVLLKSNGNNNLDYKLIDNNDNYQLSNYNNIGSDINPEDRFTCVHRNFDNTKLFLRLNNTVKYGIFESSTLHITTVVPPYVSLGQFITPSRKEDKFYVAQLNEQFIIDTQGNISQITELDNRNGPSADFNYRDNEEKIIYYINNEYFRVMNHNNGNQIMSAIGRSNQKNLTSTLDGNYIITHTKLSTESNALLIYKTERFSNHSNK
ncbi:MAG: hypothetical protein EA361_14230 [Bacteroidetes bacterium]|nr:MAG: hypothetical protein EA361_14230 [Bacteroidota bacterium]